MGRGNRPCRTAISALQDRRYVVGRAAALPHPNQRPRQRPDHLADERARPGAKLEQVSALGPAKLPETTLWAERLGHPAEGGKIVLADQMSACLVHGRHIKGIRMMEGGAGQPWIVDRRLQNRVDIGSGASAEPSVPILRYPDDAVDRDRGAAQAVQRHMEAGEVGVVGHPGDTHHLAEGMDPRIGTAGPHGVGANSEHLLESCFDLPLNGACCGLARPTAEGGAVVSDVQAQVQLLPGSA